MRSPTAFVGNGTEQSAVGHLHSLAENNRLCRLIVGGIYSHSITIPQMIYVNSSG